MDSNFPEYLEITPSEDYDAKHRDWTPAFNVAAQAIAIQKYGIAGRVWEAAYVLLRYLSELDSQSSELDPQNSEPFFTVLNGPITLLELGSGTGIVGIGLVKALALTEHKDYRVILTDLPDVCPLLQDNLRLYPSLLDAGVVSVAPLAWGRREHVSAIVQFLGGRPLTHIICSDLAPQVYFPELLAPLLRTLIDLTSIQPASQIIISYKVRSLVKETPFWGAFGLWFAFAPILSRASPEGTWTRVGVDAGVFVFRAYRLPESLGWTPPDDDDALLGGVGAGKTAERKTDETFELLLLMGLEE
ncbi:putative methyltransferase-domain-containing protein, partial [Vararia minispora EC-137]